MHNKLSEREKRILTLYFTGLVALLFIYLILGVFKPGLAALASGPQTEIAVLVPLSGPDADLGKAVVQAATLAFNQFNQESGTPRLTVRSYDSGSTPDEAASAALAAANNPATAAVLGPLDARQVAAALKYTEKRQLAVITPASTAPVLPGARGLYRIPASDERQAEAIINFISTGLRLKNIFIIYETSPVAAQFSSWFQERLANRLAITGAAKIDSSAAPAGLIAQIEAVNVQAIVYIGGADVARVAAAAVAGLKTRLPLVGIDLLMDPKLSALPADVPVHYTSAILALGAAQKNWVKDLFKDESSQQTLNLPFAYETILAARILSTTLRGGAAEQARSTAWNSLPRLSMSLGGVNYQFRNGQLEPQTMYMYRIDPQSNARSIVETYR